MKAPGHNTTTRRRAIKAILGGTVALGMVRYPGADELLAATPATIGTNRTTFDQSLGPGTDMPDGLVQYGYPTANQPAHYVRFDTTGAAFIESDYAQFPRGGREEVAAEIGQHLFLPTDAVVNHSVRMGFAMLGKSHFTTTTLSSATLAGTTGGSGKILVLDESRMADETRTMYEQIYPRKGIALERPDVVPITPSGNTAIIGAPLDTWILQHGEGGGAQTGYLLPIEGIGTATLSDNADNGVNGLDVYPNSVMSTQHAAIFVGSILPAGATLAQTHWCDPTLSGPVGLRVQMWRTGNGQPIAVLMYVQDGEANGSVLRIIVSAEVASLNRGADTSPGKPTASPWANRLT